MEMGTAFACCFSCALLLLLSMGCVVRMKMRSPHIRRADLPPGSIGLPYVGETLQLYNENPQTFYSTRQTRFGDVFKTRILGCPSVMVASPEAIRFVLVTEAGLFKPTYPSSKEKLIGPSAIFFHQGDYHTQLRKLVRGSLSLDVVRKLVPYIESIAISALESCSGGKVVNTYSEMKKFAFEVAVLSIFGELDFCHKENLKDNFYILDKGYNSLPLNLPGALYHKSLKARRRLSQILTEIIQERKQGGSVKKDLLGYLLNFKDEKGQTLTDDQISDNLVGVLFAAQDTTASVLTWILKYIHEDSRVLDAIKLEQTSIYNANEEGKKPLTWSQTRNMPITFRVMMETLRMASVIPFTYREAVEDVEYKGYLIPKGWKVLPLFRNVHHNPKIFTDPNVFDPSRFQVELKPNTFMPFGNGVHACPGNELAKLEILILLHHLVTKFRWEVVGLSSGVQYNPFPVPRHGLPAKFWKETAVSTSSTSTAMASAGQP